MEKKELRKKIARIHTAILTHTPVGRDENDFPVAATQTYLYDFISQELDKAREEGKREVFSQEELKILMWLVRDRKQGIDWNYKTKRISEWDKLVSDGLFNKLEGLSKLKDNK